MRNDKNTFLEEFNLDQDDLQEYNIDWDILMEIYEDYEKSVDKLEEYAEFIGRLLRKHKDVHTVRTRVKDKKHLIAKLIRKTPDRRDKHGEEFHFSVDNYKEEITDLVGVRVIHMFKEDWESIHEFINQTWSITESVANIRNGDDKEIYLSKNLEVDSRETGYRSVHYLVELQPTIETITAEIQVRTIFEEGYGEIDHQLRYPNYNVPRALELNLLMLNRLAGSADEMASTVKMIKNEWEEMQDSDKEKENEIESLKQQVKDLDIEQSEKESIYKGIESVTVNKDWGNVFNIINSKFKESDYYNIKSNIRDEYNKSPKKYTPSESIGKNFKLNRSQPSFTFRLNDKDND